MLAGPRATSRCTMLVESGSCTIVCTVVLNSHSSINKLPFLLITQPLSHELRRDESHEGQVCNVML